MTEEHARETEQHTLGSLIHFGEKTEHYLARMPRARLLLIALAEADIPESFVIYLQEEIRREAESRRRGGWPKETP